MEMPWKGTSGAAKFVAIFATSLGISVGLCGANFVAVITATSTGGTSAWSAARNAVIRFLVFAGYAEVLAIVVSLVGLIVMSIVLGVQVMMGKNKPPSK